MPELWPVGPTPRGGSATVRVARLASRQWGVVSRRQLRGCGLSGSTVDRWVEAGRLHRVHPAIYAVGHGRLSAEGHLAAALLYAGQGAALSAGTAAWWWGLWPDPPGAVHVVVPGQARERARRTHPSHTLDRAHAAPRLAGHDGGADAARCSGGRAARQAAPHARRGGLPSPARSARRRRPPRPRAPGRRGAAQRPRGSYAAVRPDPQRAGAALPAPLRQERRPSARGERDG